MGRGSSALGVGKYGGGMEHGTDTTTDVKSSHPLTDFSTCTN